MMVDSSGAEGCGVPQQFVLDLSNARDLMKRIPFLKRGWTGGDGLPQARRSTTDVQRATSTGKRDRQPTL